MCPVTDSAKNHQPFDASARKVLQKLILSSTNTSKGSMDDTALVRLSKQGTPLTGQHEDYDSAPWACVKDTRTDLTWEVKTNDQSLGDKHWAYTWYEPALVDKTGYAGKAHGGTCFEGNGCDTRAYVAAVNAEIRQIIEKHDCGKGIDPPPQPPVGEEQPEVPEPAPATIMPEWDGDRLVLSDTPIDAEGLDRELLVDTLRAMREQLLALADKLQKDQSSNAVDPRIIESLRDAAELIPEEEEIPRHRLIRLAEEVEELEAYLTDPDNEERACWPDILLTKATTLVQNLSRLLEKFRPWRETHQHLQEEAEKVDEQALDLLPEEAEAFAEDLQAQFEPEKLDQRIPQLLREMGRKLAEWRDAIQRRGKAAFRRAADVVESIGNVLKRIASRVVKWLSERGRKFGKALTDAIDAELKKLAQFLARWGRRLIQGGVVSGLAGASAYAAGKFGWLVHVIDWLLRHFPQLFG